MAETKNQAAQEPMPEDVSPDPADDAVAPDQGAIIAALETERDEMRDRLMRALAEAENSRKRAERDRREAENYGGSKLARDMLPVYDSLLRAIEAASDEQRQAAAALSPRTAAANS